ncbi:hypothetical protein [Chitinophaga vietnamensis]|uniref:hypothetical protein n=1 Tax=Chitinophaga vietnamensis TaxID=2593957 RepID=UPI00117889B5|nr:hypothetical protein [Chitinophaga vietnamensis]
MKTRILHLFGAMGVASTMLYSCTTSDMAKPDQAPMDEKNAASVNYELAATNTTSSLSPDASGRLAVITGNEAMAKSTSGRFDITWDTAVARLKEIRFDAKRGKDQVEFKLTTDRYVDLLTLPGKIGAIKIPVGTYQFVKVFVKVQGDKKDPAVFLKGRLTWDGKKIPVEVKLSGVIELKAMGKDVVVTDSSTVWHGKLKLSMDLVLSKLQVGDFTGSFQDGKLQINVDVNSGLHDKVVKELEDDNCLSVDHEHD